MRARLAAGLVALVALALLAVAVAAPASAARRPPSPVRDLQIASAASDSLLVSWAPPRRQGSSPVIGYRVTATAGTVTVSGSTATITGLSPGNPVSVSVAARNADGRSRTRTLQASTSSGASQEAIDYYISVALGCEYGCDGLPGAVRRFTGPVEWSVDGSVGDADRLTISAIVADWNAACPATPVSVATAATTNPVRLHLVPLDQMATAVPQYVAGNWGFFWYWSNGDGSLQRGEVVVATDISQSARDHLLREELTQVMGLSADTDGYPDSVFYGPWTETPAYSALDRELIRIHCLPVIRSGMTADEVRRALAGG
ncbi:MAG: DUF2927 domain-containing protein [Actinomycetota bacterium]|nr:DUF2927 domain-containing protein [Actinomycetota bacterium]